MRAQSYNQVNSAVKEKSKFCDLHLSNYCKFSEQRFSYALVPMLEFHVEVLKL
jgi:hypothetical protein